MSYLPSQRSRLLPPMRTNYSSVPPQRSQFVQAQRSNYYPAPQVQTDLIDLGFSLARKLVYYSHYIYYWLSDIAPVLIQAEVIQAGRDAVDRLPLLSYGTKQEIKKWLLDFCTF